MSIIRVMVRSYTSTKQQRSIDIVSKLGFSKNHQSLPIFQTKSVSPAEMSRLFTPLTVGDVKLDHRVAMAPLTRYRMDDDFKATPMSKGICTAIVAKERF